ncbi:MAG: hypothetical protein Fur0010_14880 [Bdellovibrio sp.]
MNILIVEDEDSILKLIELWLGHYQIYKAKTLKEGMLLFNQNEIDLILTDIRLAGVGDGLDLLKAIKSKNSEVPVVVMTAHGSKELAIDCIKLGAFDFIEKPFTKLELNHALEKAQREREKIIQLNRLKSELKAQNIELLEKIEDKEQFLRIICHDLANALQKILMLTEAPRFENTEKIKEIIQVQSSMISKIRNQERDKVNLNKCIDLNDVKDFLNIYFSNEIIYKNISLNFTGHWNKKLHVDPTIFKISVLGNIISNSMKFSPPGSRIELHADESESHLIITIRDFGIGMSQQQVQNLFVHANRTSKDGLQGEKGTSLGLTIVKYQVEKFGGAIRVTSNDGSQNDSETGTTFELSFKKSAA